MKLHTLSNFTNPARSGFLFLLFAAFLAVSVILMLLGAGDVEGQTITNDCHPGDAANDATLEVCLDNLAITSDPNPNDGRLEVEEGGRISVAVHINRPLTDDDAAPNPTEPGLFEENRGKAKCYSDVPDSISETPCIEGGIWAFDSYNDHEREDGERISDEGIAFVFRKSDTDNYDPSNPAGTQDALRKYLSFGVADDDCRSINRTIRIKINDHFDHFDTHGYLIDSPYITVYVQDNDPSAGICGEKGVSVSPTSLTVDEGDSQGRSYDVVLTNPPSQDVTITIAKEGDADNDVAVNKTDLTFTTQNWETKQTVAVTANDDADIADESVTIRHAATSDDPDYNGIEIATVRVNVNDTGMEPSITISPSSLSLPEGNSRNYMVRLDTQPSGNVTVTVGGHSGTVLTLGGTDINSNSELTFTDVNWNEEQTVTVTAGQVNSNQNYTLTHSSTGGGYGGVSKDLPVTVTDTIPATPGVTVSPTSISVLEGNSQNYMVRLDTQPSGNVTVTVGGHSGTVLTLGGTDINSNSELTFTDVNWNEEQTVTVTAGQVNSNQNYTLTHSSTGGGYGGVSKDLPVTVTDTIPATPGVTVTDTIPATPGVTVSPTSISVLEGNSQNYMVRLDTQPSGNVTVTVGGHSGTVLTLGGTDINSNSELTFTDVNWNEEQTVTVTAGQVNSNQNYTLTHSSTGGGYGGVSKDLPVTVTDTIPATPGVTVSPTSLSVLEGNSRNYMVRLDTQPSGNVTVTVGGHSGTVLTLGGTDINSNSELTFTDVNWNEEQTVTVTAGQVNSNQNYTLTHSSTGGGYGGVSKDLPVTVTDTIPATPGVTVSPDMLEINTGASGTYGVRLNTQPTADVTIDINTVNLPSGTTLDENSLTFTPGNGTTAQTVTVTAGSTTGSSTISHSATSTDADYNNINIASVAVTVSEPPPETPGIVLSTPELTVPEGGSQRYMVSLSTQPTDDVIVIISGHSGTDLRVPDPTLTFNSGNYGTAQPVNVSAVHDSNCSDSSITLAHTASGGGYDDESASLGVTIDDDDPPSNCEPPPTCPPTCPSSQVNLSVTPTSVREDAGQISLTVTGALNADPRLSATIVKLSIRPGSGTDAASASDYSSGTAQLRIPAGRTSSTATLSFTPVHDSVEEVDETVVVGGTTTVSSLEVGTATLTIINVTPEDPQGVTASKSSIEIEEEGDPDTYTLKLDTQPASDVTISIGVVDEAGNAVEDVTASPATVTFKPDDTYSEEQTVTVSAGHDDDARDDKVNITHTPTSDDDDYDGLGIDGVGVSVTDNDEPGVIVSHTVIWIEEELSVDADRYLVRLATEPSDVVTIAISVDEDDADSVEEVTTSPVSLTFDSGNWDELQEVLVSAGHDDDDLDDTATITHAATSTDDDYDGLDIGSVKIRVFDNDRDAGVSVDPTELAIEEGRAGDSDKYSVVLDKRPAANVTITISVVEHDGDDVAEVTTSTEVLTFTPMDWGFPQEVAVAAGPDDDSVDDFATISHSATSEDPIYNTATDSSNATEAVLKIDDVEVLVFDTNAGAGVSARPTALWIEEERSGFGDDYSVRLRTQPTADVTIVISAVELDGDDVAEVTTNPASLTFTPDNYDKGQTVIVSAGHDADTVDDVATITHTPSSTDAVYNTTNEMLLIDTVAVLVYDNDAGAGVTVSPTALWIDEERSGLADEYAVRLRTEPMANVTISISAGEEVTTSPTSLTFTPDNYYELRTVAVSAGHDSDTDDDHVDITHAATSSDGAYSGLDIDSVAVTAYDNDAEASVAISPTALWIEEERAGFADEYSVRLRTEPTANVTIAISAGEEVTTNPTSLIFTPDNWGTERTVSVSAGHDADTEDDQVDITHTATSADSSYNGLDIDSVAVTVYDNDAPASVAVSPTTLWIEEERSGLLDNYTVRLRTEPSADVAIDMIAGEEVTVSPTRLTFTPDNWSTEQTVEVRAGHDADTEDDLVNVTHTATSIDSDYHRLGIDSVAVTVFDNDMAVPSTARQETVAPTSVPVAVPTATPTPTVAPTPTATVAPTPTALPIRFQDPGAPDLDEAEQRGRNLLDRAAEAGRDRLTLVILIAIVLILAGLTFVYLILRRR